MQIKFSVSLVIPNWNGLSLLEKNLPHWIKAKNFSGNHISEIVIVDDKSTDDSLFFLRKNYSKEVKIVAHKVNRGFSSAVNTGVRTAKSQLVCLLNTDVIPSNDFLVSVVKDFNDDKVFAVSLHERGYGYAKALFESGFVVHRPGSEKNKPVESFWASGGSCVVRRDIWMELGGFDEKLFSPFYWEDVDLGYRAHKRGYKVLWEPNARVIHKHESVINEKSFRRSWLNLIKERNHLLLNWKNLTSPALFKKHKIGLRKRILTHPGYLKVFIAALLKYSDVKMARDREKKESTVSDESVFAKFS